MSLVINLDSIAEQDLDYYVPNSSISSPEHQEYAPHHYVLDRSVWIEATGENKETNFKKQNTDPPTKTTKKDKRGLGGSAWKSIWKFNSLTKTVTKKTSKLKLLRTLRNNVSPQVLQSFLQLWQLWALFVVFKFQTFFYFRLGSDKHITILPRKRHLINVYSVERVFFLFISSRKTSKVRPISKRSVIVLLNKMFLQAITSTLDAYFPAALKMQNEKQHCQSF